MSIFDNLTEQQAFNLLNTSSSTNNSGLLQQSELLRQQNEADLLAQQQRAQQEQRAKPREGFNKFLTAVQNLGLSLQGEDPKTYRAAQEKLRLDALREQESRRAAEQVARRRFAGNENMAILFRNNPEFARDFLLKELETPGVNVGPQGQKFGSPPTDTVWRRDAKGQIVLSENNTPIADPIPGTKLFESRKKVEEAKGKQQQKSIIESGLVLGSLDRIKNRVKDASWFDPGTGFGTRLTKNIAGSTAADVGELIKTINASIAFGKLQAMRDASPTGGALGQVSEGEIALLQSTIASLAQNQSEEQFLENLDLIDTYYKDIIRRFNAFPAEVMAQVGYVPRELDEQKIKDFMEIDGYKIRPKQ